jgi:hypothetical protein
MTTTTWTDVTMTIDGVDYPVPMVPVEVSRERPDAYPVGTFFGGTVSWSFTCTDDAGPFLRRLAKRCSVAVRNQRRHGQGRRRRARRRQRGRERAMAVRWLRGLRPGSKSWIRGFASSEPWTSARAARAVAETFGGSLPRSLGRG